MNVSGSSPIGSIFQPNDTAIMLRLNQRFSAEVIQVAGERVLLSIDGVQIVARMTTPDQAAALAEHHSAQFIVRDISDQTLSLQLSLPKPVQTATAASTPANLAASLLQQAGLEASAENLLLAQALLEQGLPVTPDLVSELSQLLARAGLKTGEGQTEQAAQVEWGQLEAQIAAALKAAGLPISPGALNLIAQSGTEPILEVYKRFRARLLSSAQSPDSPQTAQLLKNVLAFLDSAVVDWSEPPETIAESLRNSVRSMGRSLENELAEMIQKGTASIESLASEKGVFALLMLRRQLARDGQNALVDEIDRFLDTLRARQFMNAEPATPAVKDHWLSLDLLLGAPAGLPANADDLRESHLRIAYKPEDRSGKLDLSKSCLIIQVDLQDGGVMEVELSIVDRQIGARVTVPDQGLRQSAEAAIPELETGLGKLGFNLQAFQCQVGVPSRTAVFTHASNSDPLQFRQVNVAV